MGYATEQTLTGFSCGQGPLLYYRAAEGACATLETDTVPFGCIEDLEVALRPPVRMEPGDIFVTLSGGVVDDSRCPVCCTAWERPSASPAPCSCLKPSRARCLPPLAYRRGRWPPEPSGPRRDRPNKRTETLTFGRALL